jgi:hypothetical protein
MRALVCLETECGLRRVTWLSESKAGIYVGICSGPIDVHSSYHQDGTRHWHVNKAHHQRWKDVALRDFVGAKQLQHGAMPLNPTRELAWPRQPPTARDDVVLVPAAATAGFSDLALDVWLADHSSLAPAGLLLDAVHRRPGTIVVAERAWQLDSFPHLHLAVSVSLANTSREVPYSAP